MLTPISDTIQGVVNFTWPMIIISIVIMVSLRITYLIKNKIRFILYKELLMLTFVIYILCLFQVVTFQDVVSWSSNNFIPFKEILRYELGSRLFFKNVLGNMFMFMPYGIFVSHYLKLKKTYGIIFLTLIASLSIEIVQFYTGRVFDVDDILLNILGGFVGYMMYSGARVILDTLPQIFKREWVLNVISVILLIGLITLI